MVNSKFHLDFRGKGWQEGPETQGNIVVVYGYAIMYNIISTSFLKLLVELISSSFNMWIWRDLEGCQRLHHRLLTKGQERRPQIYKFLEVNCCIKFTVLEVGKYWGTPEQFCSPIRGDSIKGPKWCCCWRHVGKSEKVINNMIHKWLVNVMIGRWLCSCIYSNHIFSSFFFLFSN